MRDFSSIIKDKGIPWVRHWIQASHEWSKNFIDDNGVVDYEALGREEFEFREALYNKDFSRNKRAEYLWTEALKTHERQLANGSKGGRPRKNSPDTRGGSASPAGCAAGKRIPPQESTTAAGESAEKLDPPDIGGSAASAGSHYGVGEADISPEVSESSDAANRCFANPAESAAGKRSPRTAEGSAARSLPPSTAELYDFAEAARLSEADAREWWELCTDRGWKDRSGKPIRDWKKACERYCARRAINRMAKGET